MRRPPAWPLLLSAALAVSACHREPPAPEPRTVTVRIAPATTLGGVGAARYSASVTPNTQVDVSFKANGYIVQIRQLRGADGRMRDLQQGDTVKKGTVLAKLRNAEYLDKVTTATANLEKANASLEKATADFKRATDLIATESITQPDYDSAKREYETAQASVLGANAQLDEARINLAYTDLIAPLDGVVLSRKIEVGGLVGPGTVGFVMADLSSVKVVFNVADVTLRNLVLGESVEITTESFPGRTFSGKVTAVAPSADTKTRGFEIEVSIANPRGDLKDGMVAALRLPGTAPAAAAAALAVPLSAVVRSKSDASGYSVFVVADSGGNQVARMRAVQLGQVHGDSIAVVSGVDPSDRIIVTGGTIVTDGDRVRIVP